MNALVAPRPDTVFDPQRAVIYRRAIEGGIEFLIDLLDRIDGNPDIEDDDPEFDVLELGEPEGEGPGPVLLPAYGIDQSAGPVNYEAAICQHRARQQLLESRI